MSGRLCPGCDVRIARGDPSLAACVNCKRVFHQISLSLTASVSPQTCAGCSAPPNVASSVDRARGTTIDAQSLTTLVQPISPAADAASHSTTPSISRRGVPLHLLLPSHRYSRPIMPILHPSWMGWIKGIVLASLTASLTRTAQSEMLFTEHLCTCRPSQKFSRRELRRTRRKLAHSSRYHARAKHSSFSRR